MEGGNCSASQQESRQACRCEIPACHALRRFLGKKVHSAIRGKVVSAIADKMSASQFSGLAGRGSDMCSHAAKLFQDFCQAEQLSSAMLFGDVPSAYYSVTREVVAHGREDHAAIGRVINALHFGDDVERDIWSQVEGPCVMNDSWDFSTFGSRCC